MPQRKFILVVKLENPFKIPWEFREIQPHLEPIQKHHIEVATSTFQNPTCQSLLKKRNPDGSQSIRKFIILVSKKQKRIFDTWHMTLRKILDISKEFSFKSKKNIHPKQVVLRNFKKYIVGEAEHPGLPSKPPCSQWFIDVYWIGFQIQVAPWFVFWQDLLHYVTNFHRSIKCCFPTFAVYHVCPFIFLSSKNIRFIFSIFHPFPSSWCSLFGCSDHVYGHKQLHMPPKTPTWWDHPGAVAFRRGAQE